MKKYLPWILIVIPIIGLLFYVIAFTPKIPMADQWGMVPFLANHSFDKLFAPINEHRVFFPRTISLISITLSRWNPVIENLISLLFFISIILLIFRAFIENIDNKTAQWIFTAAVLVQLSPIHHESLLWAGMAHLLCVLMLIIAISHLECAAKSMKCFFLLILSLFIASFSFLSGLFGWIICLINMILLRTYRKTLIFLFIIIAIINYFFYLYGISILFKASENTDIISRTCYSISYFFVYMGANFVPTYKVGCFLSILLFSSGIFGLIITISGIWLQIQTWGNNIQGKVLPYSMMWLGFMQAITTAVGRPNEGLPSALLSRYHIFQMLYFFGFIWLLIIYLISNEKLHKYKNILISVFILLVISNWVGGIALGFYKINKYLPVEKELRLKSENISDDYAKLIYGDPKILRQRIKQLKEMKFNVFRN